MIYDKRKVMKFDIPLIMEFKPQNKVTDYSWGLTRNFSYEGFSFETQNFDFEPEEILELKLKFPHSDTFVSVLGDVVWKSKDKNKCLAEVRLRDMNEEDKKRFLEKISNYRNIPIEWFLYKEDNEVIMKKVHEEKPVKEYSKEQRNGKKSDEKTESFGIKKEYLKTGSTCRITFRLPKEAAADAYKVTIVGDFNGWDNEGTVMKRIESGGFEATLELISGKEYRFRYLIDGDRWENDWYADKYIPNQYGCEDSVIVI
jgi:hypothetical protein